MKVMKAYVAKDHSSTFLPALTGMRALAALLIFIAHYPPVLSAPNPLLERAIDVVTAELHIGVSIFFTLSGYLLSRRYFSTLGRHNVGAFLWRRFARIYPLYFLLCSISFLRVYGRPGFPASNWWPEYLLNITLLKGFSQRWYLTGIPPAWSLVVEESFYLLLPVLVLLARRFSLKVWLAVPVILLASGLLLSLVLRDTGWMESYLFVLQATFFGRAGEFLIGAAFAQMSATRFPHATSLGLGGMLLALAALVGIHAGFNLSVSIHILPGLLVNNWVLPLATGLFLHGLAAHQSGLRTFLSSKPLLVAGYCSYAFYLLHLSFFSEFVLARLHRHAPSWPPTPVLFLLTMGASLGLYYLVEKPMRLWLLHLFPLSGR